MFRVGKTFEAGVTLYRSRDISDIVVVDIGGRSIARDQSTIGQPLEGETHIESW